ncbi:10338_t:CDS:2 [Entrophospora sp. SA101]|nr:10338_t:CDS:2 [Entrophospora sp. SA101]
MPKIPRIIPWTSPEEFTQVHEWLYSENLNLKKLGVKRVKAWINRGKVPHSIISTSSFVEITLSDEFNEGKLSQYELRLLYSIVLIRFVNGLVDPIQQNYYAISISTLAGQLNLPLWFVELRHASTHQDLPSLNVLRNASKQELINLWLPMLKKFDETWSNFIDELVEEMLEILVNNEDYYKDKILPKLSSSRLPSHKSISSYFLTIVEYDEKLKSNSRPFLSYIDKLVEDAHNNDNDNDGNNNNLENHNIGLYSSDSHQKISNYSSSSPSTSSMVLFNPEEWNPCPIGCLVNGQVPCLDLPLELDDNNDDDSNFF